MLSITCILSKDLNIWIISDLRIRENLRCEKTLHNFPMCSDCQIKLIATYVHFSGISQFVKILIVVCKGRLLAAMFWSAERTHLRALAVLVRLLDVCVQLLKTRPLIIAPWYRVVRRNHFFEKYSYSLNSAEYQWIG